MPGNSFQFQPVNNLPWYVYYNLSAVISVATDGSAGFGLNTLIETWADGLTFQINAATVVDYNGQKIFDQNHTFYNLSQNPIIDASHNFWDANQLKILDNNHLVYDTDGNGAVQFANGITYTINPIQFNGGTKSSDGSAGISTTITTASLVGKTITIKNGLIVGFA